MTDLANELRLHACKITYPQGETFSVMLLAADEIERLRSKIETMEKQKPVGGAFLCVRCSTPFDGEHYCPACGHHTATEETVYATPGAQPAPSVPEKIKRVESGFKGMFLREAQAYKQGWNECRAAMIAAAGKAAKRHEAQEQPAPSMPDLLESLRCACNYIDKLGGVSQQYRAMLAAAPEAKP